jgi:hypothetical protein
MVVFVNMQRMEKASLPSQLCDKKIIYRPFLSTPNKNVFLEKVRDFTKAPAFMIDLINRHNIEVIIARGSPAGGLAYLIWKKTKVPFFVESFEPHAEYMRESGVWKVYDPRFIIEHYLESKQKKLASGLMPVAAGYSDVLLKGGIQPKKVKTVPCAVNAEAFTFSPEKRNETRLLLQIEGKSVVGIYVGRYGGLYLQEEAFTLYNTAFSFFGGNFHLILLVPIQYLDWVHRQIKKYSLPQNNVHIRSVPHHQVPAYLSASDFAFATYRPGTSNAYLSPVKVGEYWANGLPVLLTEGVGDETNIIKKHTFAGVLFDVTRINDVTLFKELKGKIPLIRGGNEISALALKYRGLEPVKEAYMYFLNQKEDAKGSTLGVLG